MRFTKFFGLIIILCFCLFMNVTLTFAGGIIQKKERENLITDTAHEMERLDGEGLVTRQNRPETWHKTIRRLKREAGAAKNSYALGQVFKRLNATYPNLHAALTLAPEYDLQLQRGSVLLGMNFGPEIIQRDQENYNYQIVRVRSDWMTNVPEIDLPHVGDELVAINKRPMKWWSRENFIFCKFPLREQCEDVFLDNLRRELLDWNRTRPLLFTLKRGKKVWTVQVPIEEQKNSPSPSPINLPCDVDPNRYPGFHPVYQGYNACIFESEKYPDTSVWRIKSFLYPETPEESQEAEVASIWNNYWKGHSVHIKKVIFDVIGNGGGNAPIPWYQMFFSKPFQEQYFQLKKNHEIEDNTIRSGMFWGENAHEIWFQQIKDSGVYKDTPFGQFLPSQPDFCADHDKNCDETSFLPTSTGFLGDIVILVDEHCVSACSSFVWEFKDVLKDKVKLVGFPDSADTAYSRVSLYAFLDQPKHHFQVMGQQTSLTNNSENFLFKEQIPVSRPTNKKGEILTAKPQHIDVWIPRSVGSMDNKWTTSAFQAALEL